MCFKTRICLKMMSVLLCCCLWAFLHGKYATYTMPSRKMIFTTTPKAMSTATMSGGVIIKNEVDHNGAVTVY